MWKQTIEYKIENQAKLLKLLDRPSADIMALAKDVKSGDSENKEGTAARLYWPRLFGSNFIRDRFGDFPNELLNYGYIILRAAVARSLVGSGLLPTLGVHHRNKYNAYCLADDIMEPYRPYIDENVIQLMEQYGNQDGISQTVKAELLQIPVLDVIIDGRRSPLMIAVSNTVTSLYKCFSGECRKLTFPKIQSIGTI